MAVSMALPDELDLEPRQLETQVTTSIIVPAYNEEIGLPVVLEKIFNVIDLDHEVVVVDDGSHDATSQVASMFPCRVIRHHTNRGKGEALKTGIKHSRGHHLIFIDADDTYPAEALPRMARALESYDIVYGSRANGRHNIPRFNRVGNAMLNRLMRRLYGFKPRDYSTGLYGIKKCHLEVMKIASQGFSIEPEIAIKASRMKLQMKEILIEYRPRLGETKLRGLTVGREHLKTMINLRRWRPPYEVT